MIFIDLLPRRSRVARAAIGALATGAMAASLIGSSINAGAQGYAEAPVIAAPLGSFTNVLATVTVATQTITVSAPGEVVTIPGGALPPGTQVSILEGDPSVIQGLPPGQHVILESAVGWLTSDGSSPNASTPITVTITNSLIHPGDTVYVTTARGLQGINAVVSEGRAVFALSQGEGFVIASAAAIPGGPGQAGGGATQLPRQASPTALVAVIASLTALGGVRAGRRRLTRR
jgi:hypothetical protein